MSKIAQADRDAAETYRQKVLDAIWAAKPEDDVLLEAFARHRMEERERIVAIIKDRIDIINGFINGLADSQIKVPDELFSAPVELRSLLRELQQ